VTAPNPDQAAAIAARGRVFVSAGAGTGKTMVLVERFARAVCEEGVDVGSTLVITYTERAAAELRARIRQRLVAAGRVDLARELDGAWISTIHGWCHRLLKAYPLAAGIDPRFRVLDDSQSRVLRSEAFAAALGAFCGARDPDRLRLLATYGAAGLRRMLIGVYETLRSAGRPLVLESSEPAPIDDAVAEVRAAARCVLDDPLASDRGRERASRLLELLEAPPPPELLLDLSEYAVRGERFESYEQARKALAQGALDVVTEHDRTLLQKLLEGFAAAYRSAKERESALDFEDLQLVARDLLRDRPEIQERERLRFREVMVDEFQDTNLLQCDLVDLLAGQDVFFVGDEFQSIYGFRHADVSVFRERREQAAGVLALRQNYRSRPEVLAVVNELFGADFGDQFQPLAASGEFPDPVFGPPVELLVTDKTSYAGSGEHWRRAEAKAVAQRIRDLVDAGVASPGEIVLLFAAGTDAEWYEEELRALELPTFRATGRGYYGQQQVVDLLAYLRLLHNRYDDEALVTVLASPFVGISNDALVLLRRAAGRRPLFCGLERSLPAGIGTADERLLQAFRQRYDRLAAASATLSLERLCEQIVSEHDYDLAVLAQWDGRRRYANLRKLMRIARSYEELRGADVEGFVRFVQEQDAAGARELEAAAEEEEADVVRLLTIHAAKGLEFKVVVVADAGRDRPPSPDEILALPDGRFGFRVIDPVTGKRHGSSGFDAVRAARRGEDEAERRRLYYVAMTRAVDRLIVAGSLDPDRADASTPIGWVLGRLGVDLSSVDQTSELEYGGARLLLHVDRYTEPASQPAAEPADRQLALFDAAADGALAVPALPLPALAPVPEPPLHRVRRLSYSALALFERCSYRFYAERIVGLRPHDEASAVPADGLAGIAIGDAVHRLLEQVDLRAPFAPDVEQVRAWYPAVSGEELGRIRALLEAYCASELAARIAALEGAAVERAFAFEHDGVLLHGRFDVFHLANGRAFVVDYKTNLLDELAPADLVEHDYRLQRLVYALACFRAGAQTVEVVYQFLEQPDEPVASAFGPEDVARLESELSAAIAAIQEGRFRPTPSDVACAGCPALDLVCAGPRLAAAAKIAPLAAPALAG
jgi:ATP-dependent exoDNAse (exonuclease V) beta subunit